LPRRSITCFTQASTAARLSRLGLGQDEHRVGAGDGGRVESVDGGHGQITGGVRRGRQGRERLTASANPIMAVSGDCANLIISFF
jgi:hypothetical protein